jgi:hypothetical protein
MMGPTAPRVHCDKNDGTCSLVNTEKLFDVAAQAAICLSYECHPFANAFPMMTDQEHAELVAS